MTEAVPNLWPRKFSRGILTPLAVLRVQAAKFKEMTDGLLDAEVVSSNGRDDEGTEVQSHSLEIIAPALDYYRRSILTAEHDNPGAYPVFLVSQYLSKDLETEPLDRLNYATIRDKSATCNSQAGLLQVLQAIFNSPKLTGFIESLIAQINDAEAVPA